MTARTADPEWVRFRMRIIRALDRIDASRFHYLDEDRFVHVCPVCDARDGWLTVRFIGRTSRADITCSMGCRDDELARALGLEARP